MKVLFLDIDGVLNSDMYEANRTDIEDFFGIRKDYSLSSADKARVLSEAQKLKAKKKK